MSTAPDSVRPPLGRSIGAGLGAGAVSAVVTSLVSLHLQSPDRVFINSASVSVAILLAALVTGLVFHSGRTPAEALRNVVAWLAGAFLAVSLVALAVEAAPGHPLLHVATFCIPLAAIAMLLLGLLTPVLVRPSLRPAWVGPIAGVAALALAVMLAVHGGLSRGRLSLPTVASGGVSSAGNAGRLGTKDVSGKSFVVDPSQSKATYSVREQLANLPLPDDAVGNTSQVSGTVFLDGRPSTVSVDVGGFKSDNPGRDQHLLRDPGLANFAPAQFTTTRIDLPDSYTPGDTITSQVQGTMKLNNVEKPMTFAVEARLQDKTLSIHGSTDFTWSDFNIRPPSFGGVLQIADTIHAEVLLVAKAQS